MSTIDFYNYSQIQSPARLHSTEQAETLRPYLLEIMSALPVHLRLALYSVLRDGIEEATEGVSPERVEEDGQHIYTQAGIEAMKLLGYPLHEVMEAAYAERGV